LLLSGCATGPNANPQDPLEPFNRGVYRFNDTLDSTVVKPVATGYRDTVPSPVRTGVSNFFGNLRDAWSVVNGVLQGRPREAAEDFMRVNVNTVFGLFGLIDIASDMGIPRTTMDFGQTMGRWGAPSGPYLVLPVLGPSTVRDTAGLIVDAQGDPVSQGGESVATRNSAYVLRAVDTRSTLLSTTDLVEQAALDKYSFVRDAYLQRRDEQVNGPRQEERYDQ
jgi:phospholipid-binding lipoprotein MlaA